MPQHHCVFQVISVSDMIGEMPVQASVAAEGRGRETELPNKKPRERGAWFPGSSLSSRHPRGRLLGGAKIARGPGGCSNGAAPSGFVVRRAAVFAAPVVGRRPGGPTTPPTRLHAAGSTARRPAAQHPCDAAPLPGPSAPSTATRIRSTWPPPAVCSLIFFLS